MKQLSTIGYHLNIQIPSDEQLAQILEDINSSKEDGLNITVIISPDQQDLTLEHKSLSLKLEVRGELARADRAVDHLRKNWTFSQSSEFIQVQIQIPESQHQEPVISHLVSDFGVTVNIHTAFLGANGAGGGWFALSIEGERNKLEKTINYLADQNLLIA
jgi:ABC-type methionine transport system ATPase subunit